MIAPLSFLLIIFVSLASIVANSLLRFGLKQTGLQSLVPSYILKNIFRVIFNPFVLGGFIIFAVGALVWLRVLSQEPLGKSYPVFVGFTIIFLIISSSLFLGESITVPKLIGMILIVAGTVLAFRI